MSHVTRRGPVKPTLNITPLIDVVFLLIVFFMIVNNIVTDEVPELQLPDLEDPVTNQHDARSRIIVNIVPEHPFEPDNDGRLGPGYDVAEVLRRPGDAIAVTVGYQSWATDDPEQLEAFREYLGSLIATRMNGDPNRAPMIILRSDSAIYYSEVRIVFAYLQAAMLDGGLDPEIEGHTNIHIVAYMPD